MPGLIGAEFHGYATEGEEMRRRAPLGLVHAIRDRRPWPVCMPRTRARSLCRPATTHGTSPCIPRPRSSRVAQGKKARNDKMGRLLRFVAEQPAHIPTFSGQEARNPQQSSTSCPAITSPICPRCDALRTSNQNLGRIFVMTAITSCSYGVREAIRLHLGGIIQNPSQSSLQADVNG